MSGVRIEGLDLVRANAARARIGYPREQARVIGPKLAEPVVVAARGRARKRSGRMAGTIRARTTETTVEVEAGAGIDYAAVQHYGGYNNITANPFLTDPLAEMESRLVATYDQLTSRFIENVWVDS
jgi:phage gpG-like protein